MPKIHTKAAKEYCTTEELRVLGRHQIDMLVFIRRNAHGSLAWKHFLWQQDDAPRVAKSLVKRDLIRTVIECGMTTAIQLHPKDLTAKEPHYGHETD